MGPTRLGCFEEPSDEKEPSSGIDIPELLTLNKQVDGLSEGDRRCFVMGHRLQFKGTHKTRSCAYHNVDLALQGKDVKTLIQV